MARKTKAAYRKQRKKEITLHQKTLHLFDNRPVHVSLEKIHTHTGVPITWLKVLHRIKNPSVNLIEKLYDYLATKPLKV